MLGVILSVLHILAAIFVVFLTLRLLYYMFKNIKKKDWRSVVFNVIILVTGTLFFYHHFFVMYDVSEEFTEIITYFS